MCQRILIIVFLIYVGKGNKKYMVLLSQFDHQSYREFADNNSFVSFFKNSFKKLKLSRCERNILIGKNVKFHDITGIYLSKGVTIGDNSIIYIEKGCKVNIGENASLQGWNYIQADQKSAINIGAGAAINLGTKIIGGDVSIGNDCIIAHDVSIVCVDHLINTDRPATYCETITGKIFIDNNVWIGCRSVILKNVKIGHHAIIGAGSVVTKDVEPATVVAGNPARIIKYLE